VSDEGLPHCLSCTNFKTSVEQLALQSPNVGQLALLVLLVSKGRRRGLANTSALANYCVSVKALTSVLQKVSFEYHRAFLYYIVLSLGSIRCFGFSYVLVSTNPCIISDKGPFV
jgi:hypothetical protein